jgi:hypothetical protein
LPGALRRSDLKPFRQKLSGATLMQLNVRVEPEREKFRQR